MVRYTYVAAAFILLAAFLIVKQSNLQPADTLRFISQNSVGRALHRLWAPASVFFKRGLLDAWSKAQFEVQTNCSCKDAEPPQAQDAAEPKPVADAPVSACQLTGTVQDCLCQYADVEKLNRDVLHPTLSQLVKLPFFRYFKVNLYCDCPFWPDDGMCVMRDCAVCECEPQEVPRPWLQADSCSMSVESVSARPGSLGPGSGPWSATLVTWIQGLDHEPGGTGVELSV